MRHLPVDTSKPARKGADLRMGDWLASEPEKRRENCWGQAVCVNGMLAAMFCVFAPVPWRALSPEHWEDTQMLTSFIGMGNVLQLAY